MLFFWAFSLLWTDALVARSGHMSNERLECSAGTFKKTSSFQSKRLSLCTHIFLAVLAVAFLSGIYETYCCDKIVDYNITWPSIKCLSCQRKTEHGKLLRNILIVYSIFALYQDTENIRSVWWYGWLTSLYPTTIWHRAPRRFLEE